MKPPSFFAALNLSGKRCLVVGSDAEAERRVEALLECGAEVILVTETPSLALNHLASAGKLTLHQRRFREGDLEGQWLAILASRDAPLAAEMGQAAEEKRVFFCAIDQPDNNSFAHMALARAGLVTAAISTEGRAPSLGRKLRDELSQLFARAGLPAFAEGVAALRAETTPETRAETLRHAVDHVRIEGDLRLKP